MATEKVHEIPIANVARVEIVTEETTARTFRVTTADKAKIEAFVSEGEEKELRKGNRLLAQLKTEDLISETHSPVDCGEVYGRLVFDRDFPVGVQFDWRCLDE